MAAEPAAHSQRSWQGAVAICCSCSLSMASITLLERLSGQDTREWRDLASKLQKVGDSLPPALSSIRQVLSERGDTFHTVQALDRLLGVLANDPESVGKLRGELLASGLVVDVSRWVGDGLCWVAWRRTFEGEAALALNVVRHLATSGSIEVIYGEPGTGKSEQVAQRIAQADTAESCVYAGSAQNNSARSLEQRVLAKHGLSVSVGTVHQTYGVSPDPELTNPGTVASGVLVAAGSMWPSHDAAPAAPSFTAARHCSGTCSAISLIGLRPSVWQKRKPRPS